MKKNILVNCLSINPNKGGEWAVGWNVVKYLGQHCNVTVLYPNDQFNNSTSDIEREVGKKPDFYKNIRFIAVDNSEKGKKLHEKTKGKTLAISRYYLYKSFDEWMKQSFEYAKELVRKETFDAVHQLTMCGFREPGYMWKLDLPFYWGPIIGYWHIPFRYFYTIGLRELLLRFGQKQINYIQAHSGKVIKAGKKSVYIWTNEKKIMSDLILSSWKTRGGMLHEAGVKSNELKSATLRTLIKGETLKLISVSGHGSRRKGLYLVIKALKQLKQFPIDFTIIGNGNDTAYQKRMVEKYGLQDKVHFLGKVEYTKIPSTLKESHLYVHPSLIDAVSSSTCEALASGLPILCHDIYGLGYAVTDESGFKLPRISPKNSVRLIEKELKRILMAPELIEQKSKGAIKRAHELTWEKLAEGISENYN